VIPGQYFGKSWYYGCYSGFRNSRYYVWCWTF
jgi:hypothetical protein